MKPAVAILTVALLMGGCSREEVLPTDAPLLDGRHEPDILTEARKLELPPSTAGNRWAHGFSRVVRQKKLARLVPRETGARLEFVNLESRPRRMTFLSKVVAAPTDGPLSVRIAGGEPVIVPISGKIEFDLGGELPLGRVSVDLQVPPGTVLAGRRVDLSAAHRPGRVEFRDEGVRQAGWSAVDFSRWVDPGTVLLGRFRPPAEAEPGQSFSISVENDAGEVREVFSWTGSWLESMAGEREFEVDLGSAAGPQRIRFLATGVGAPGSWLDLRVRGHDPPPLADVPQLPRVVIFYLFDALRADFVPGFGGSVDVAPNLARLGEEGVSFVRHYSIAPNTKPSVKSLFSGRPAVFDGHSKLPEDGPPTLADKFRNAGFKTAALSGSPYVSNTYGTLRGFDYFEKGLAYRQQPNGGNLSAEEVHKSALRWLGELEDSDRGFLYLHTMNPHNPYSPPARYQDVFTAGIDSEIDGSTKTLMAIKRLEIDPSAADMKRLTALYASGIAYNDAELNTFMEEIASLFDPGEVMVIFTADHGDELFEHGGVLHGYTLYEDQVRIPLIFWWPGVLEPGRVERVTDHLDLHATLSQMASTSDRGQGAAFWGLLTQGADVVRDKRVVFASASGLNGGIFMANSGVDKLIWAPRTDADWGMGQGRGRDYNAEYFFDLASDPGEMRNLAAGGTVREAWLRSLLLAWIERGRLEEVAGEIPELDEDTRKRLEALGYLE